MLVKVKKNIKIKEKKYMKYLDKKKKERVSFNSALQEMEIAYSNNEVKKFCHEVNSVRKVFTPQSLPIRDKEGNMVSKKRKFAKMV